MTCLACKPLRRSLPLLLLAAGVLAFQAAGLQETLSFQGLRDNREALLVWVGENRWTAALLFLALYATAVVFLPPSGTAMTLAGGFVFGAGAGTLLAVIAATAGATALFLIARLSVGAWLHERAGPFLRRLENGFRDNELSYMLMLRLIPLFPFWLVNIAPAFLGVSLRAYVIGTLLGIVPGTAVYASLGAGLGSVFERSETLSLASLMTPEMLAGLTGLGLLALLPVGYRKWKERT
ncbi:MAG: VTT domain-containing protein [Magnetospirillum sp. WYHS-4]